MPTLTIKNTPLAVVRRLRQRAKANHRSLQGELLCIVEAASRGDSKMSTGEFMEAVVDLNLKSPPESVRMIREDRDGR